MLRAVGSAGLPEDVSVAAPVRTCTDGHSKSGGRVGPPADALALEPLEVNHDGSDGIEIEGIAEQPPSSGTTKASVGIKPRRGKRNSDTPTPPRNPPRLRSGMANSR